MLSVGNIEDIVQACERILQQVREKSKESVNPILLRIQVVVNEMQQHLAALTKAENQNDLRQKKYHWSVLYRDGDMLDEMMTLLHNTTPVFIQTDVNYITQRLIYLTTEVIQTFGRRESYYIITPKFQELAGIW